MTSLTSSMTSSSSSISQPHIPAESRWEEVEEHGCWWWTSGHNLDPEARIYERSPGASASLHKVVVAFRSTTHVFRPRPFGATIELWPGIPVSFLEIISNQPQRDTNMEGSTLHQVRVRAYSGFPSLGGTNSGVPIVKSFTADVHVTNERHCQRFLDPTTSHVMSAKIDLSMRSSRKTRNTEDLTQQVTHWVSNRWHSSYVPLYPSTYPYFREQALALRVDESSMVDSQSIFNPHFQRLRFVYNPAGEDYDHDNNEDVRNIHHEDYNDINDYIAQDQYVLSEALGGFVPIAESPPPSTSRRSLASRVGQRLRRIGTSILRELRQG